MARTDSSQTYALFLPSRYAPDRRWPLLLVLDPRGRALLPLERFRASAERFGWIVMSSYNTRSDTSEDPNVAALTAMVEDANDLLTVDPRRVYLAGFSGTARVGWVIAQQMGDQVAGLLGFGAGLPGLHVLPYLAEGSRERRLAYFGGAGRTDFNYDELHELDGALDRLPVDHRIVYFPGPHAWPPEEVMAMGLAYMELHAMQAGLRGVNPELVETLYAEDLGAARRLQQGGWLLEAHSLLESIGRDYRNLREIPAARRLAAEITGSSAYVGAAEQATALREEAERYRVSFAGLLDEYDRKKKPPRLERSLERLKIGQLRERASGEDPRDALAARRLLATVLTQSSFYKPGDYMASGQPEKAAAMLAIARAIRPDSGRICLQLARARAEAGQTAEAVSALRCALEKGALTEAALAQDSSFDRIRDLPEVRHLLEEPSPPRP